MCIAELNRSTSPCGHTYFRLTRPCSSLTNLANCAKLSLSGWENRAYACAVCEDGAASDPVNYRLLGSDEPTSPGGPTISRTNSLSTMTTTSLASARRDSRRGSLTRSESSMASAALGNAMPVPPTYSAPLAPMNEYQAAKNISQAQRVDAYLAHLPESITRGQQVSTSEDRNPADRGRTGSKLSSGGAEDGDEVSSDGDRLGVKMGWGRKSRRLTKSFFETCLTIEETRFLQGLPAALRTVGSFGRVSRWRSRESTGNFDGQG